MKLACRQMITVTSIFLALCLISPLAVGAEMVKKVDNFIVFMDQSGSMAQAKAKPGDQKLDRAVEAVKRLDQAVPELGYTSSVSLFAPYKTVSQPATYKTGSIGSAAGGFKPAFNSFTTMGDGLKAVGSAVGNLSGKTALIMFTDGAWNTGSDPVAAAKAIYGQNSSNLCIHVVSYADTPKGQKTIDAIKALSGCSIVVDGKSLDSDAAMNKFAKDVLYDVVQPAPVVEEVIVIETPTAEIVIVKEVITFNLLFDFDKSNIKDEMVPVLEEVQMILKDERDTNFILSGHTDSTGPETYNQGLSERRAASVKDWLTNNGVSAARLEAVGFGETRSKYNNDTKEGRKLNRRVELQSK
jgi:OOP family OmpA-OmpF porin